MQNKVGNWGKMLAIMSNIRNEPYLSKHDFFESKKSHNVKSIILMSSS